MLESFQLQTNDAVEIIAPASHCSLKELQELKGLLESWGLQCLVAEDIFGEDLLCAHNDKKRFEHLYQALINPTTKALICARGGYGSMRLIPYLQDMPIPRKVKIMVGMSDITALHLYIQQEWKWPSLHGALAPSRFSTVSIQAHRQLLFNQDPLDFSAILPLNAAARVEKKIKAPIIGGNLTLIQTSLGTLWQIQAKEKIILIEEINERAYRVDRMLEQLWQANIFEGAAAILFADFLGGEEPNKTSLILPVLKRFAEKCPIPVVKMQGVGHGSINYPLPLGIPILLTLGARPALTISFVC